tara:strand:+ start:8450 stop:9724 length:1275 start_codon:yes stop_codon:yes gene_type:complete
MADNPFLGSANPQQFIQQQQLLPPEMQQESRDISRQQRLADMLTGQVFNQPQGQMVSGRYVAPSFFQNLAPLAQAYFGNQISEKAGAKQVALAQGLRERQVKDAELFSEAMSGVPADETTGRPAIAPDYKAAVRIALNSYDPAIRAQGMEMLKGIKLGEGETIQRMNFGTGKMESVATGGAKMPDTVKTAAMTLGITGDPTTWTPQQTQAVANQVMAQKRATATNVSITQSTGKSLAGEIGPMMKESVIQTQGAYSTIDAADKILTALETNNLITGPLAQQRIQAGRVATTLGFAGKDEGQKLANTTQAVQGLAGLVLAGRRQMRGEGAITGSESQLAERAMSGDINFTPIELVSLANAAKRVGQYQIQTHNQRLDAMKTDPELKALIPFYSVSPMSAPATPAAAGTPAATPAMSAADKIIGGQ